MDTGEGGSSSLFYIYPLLERVSDYSNFIFLLSSSYTYVYMHMHMYAYEFSKFSKNTIHIYIHFGDPIISIFCQSVSQYKQCINPLKASKQTRISKQVGFRRLGMLITGVI